MGNSKDKKLLVIGGYMYKKCEEILNKLENEGKIKRSDFQFPSKQELKLRLKDMLENEVDEKYYLSDKMMNYVLDNNDAQKGTKWEGRAENDTLNSEIAHTLSVRGAGGNQRAGVSNFIIDNFDEEIKVKDIKLRIEESTMESKLPGAYGRNFGSKGKLQDINESCDTLQAAMGTGGGNIPIFNNNLRIRKLTPKECWRLMGFDDDDFERAAKVNSNSQLYKQAGNSIVVNVLEAIIKNLLIEYIKPDIIIIPDE